MTDNANRPHVHLITILHFLNNLRCHIQWRSQHLGQPFVPVEPRCKAEICQFALNLIIRCLFDQNILRLYVSVDDILFVHVVQGQCCLIDTHRGLLFGKLLFLDNSVVEFTAGDQFAHNIEIVIIFDKLVDPGDVGVVRGGENVQLLRHQVEQDLVFVDFVFLDCLDRILFAGILVSAGAHFTERTLAQDFTDFVKLAHILYEF